ncbi:MAG: glycosyltransferase family 2 protein [Agathobacter sp.]|nr:glycosyltransferase family 2 protein [Agathobacter sp.]
MNKYSVVIPMYNSAETITESLDSILQQTKYELIDEIVIVDDGSKDDSVSVVQGFIERTKCNKIHLIQKENGGAASARNVGIASAKNDWIALLDADDTWNANKIQLQDAVLEAHPNIKALGTNRDGEVISHGTQIKEGLYHLTPFQYCVKNWPCTPSLIFNKKVFSNQLYFDESLSHAEEGIFYLDLAAKAGLYYISEPLVLCGGGKPAFGHSGLSGNIKKMHQGVLKMMKIAYKKGYLSTMEYIFVNALEYVKYLRRKLIVASRK